MYWPIRQPLAVRVYRHCGGERFRMDALVIDDEAQVRGFVATVLRDEGWEVSEAESAGGAFEMRREREWAMVFCGVMMGGANGFSVLKRFKDELPRTKVVLMTGHGSAMGALDATAFGAYDYLLKPFAVEALQSVSRAMTERLTHSPRHRLVSSKGSGSTYQSDIEMAGRSGAIIEVVEQWGRGAGTNLPGLLTGESGTGKEVGASALHRRRARGVQTFGAVNSAGVP